MATPSPITPAASGRRETARVQLARLASQTAIAHPAVEGLDGGVAGRHSTFAGTERLPGVVVVADGDRYAVELFLVVRPTDLRALSAELQDAVRRATAAAGAGDAISDVHVTFTDLSLPDPAPQP